MPEEAPTISTHVLDTGAGQPAPGVRVTLARLGGDGGETAAGEGRTDPDGRIRRLLDGPLTSGVYALTFHLDDRAGTFQRVRLELRVSDVARSYHVPLLLAPHAVTSYRGS
jgi:5-hydroxyisourate hydrolase